MTRTPVNVSALIPWRRLLEHLGVDAPDGRSRTSRCPVCRQPATTTYQDTVQGGHWHYCHACRVGRDSVELAAATGNTTIADAVERLVEVGLLDRSAAHPETVEAYEAWYVVRRAKTEAFWKAASGALPGSGGATYGARQRFGIVQLDPAGWHARGASVLGSVDLDALRDYLAPAKWVFGAGGWKTGDTGRRRDETEAVIAPYYDLPGRISAFQYVFCDKHGRLTRYHRHAFSSFKSSNVYRAVGGLCPFEGLVESPVAAPLVVFAHPDLAIRLQLRHRALSTSWLPAVGAWPSGPVTPVVRESSPGREIVVWAERADADAFRHARAYDARLYVPQTPELLEQVTGRMEATPGAYLKLVVRDARPWREVFYRAAVGAKAAELDAVLEQLGASREEIDSLVRAAPAEVRRVVAATRYARPPGLSVRVGGREVTETADGWRLDDGELIADAALRIDEILIRPGTELAWYRGVAVYKGREYPFTARREEFELHPFKYLRTVLLAAGAGIPRYKERWRGRAVETALALHEPKTVVAPVPGWYAPDEKIVFPTFSVAVGGVVESCEIPADVAAPLSAVFAKPAPADTGVVDLLSEPGTGTITWPALAIVLHNLLAPAFGRPQRTSALTGRGSGLRAAALACGCPHEPAHTLGKANHALLAPLEGKGWPLVVEAVPTGSRGFMTWLETPGRNVVAEMDDFTADVLFASGGWFRVHTPASRLLKPETAGALSRVLPDVVQFVMERGMTGAAVRNHDLAEWVTGELMAYADARGAKNPGVFLSHLLWRPAARADAFADVVHEVADLDGFGERCLRLKGDVVWIPQAALNDTLERRGERRFRIPGVGEALRAAAVLVDEVGENGEAYWLVERPWYDSRRRRAAGPRLRITGTED